MHFIQKPLSTLDMGWAIEQIRTEIFFLADIETADLILCSTETINWSIAK